MQVITYKFKVYTQNRNHSKRLNEWFKIACWIYNHCISLHKRYYKLYKRTLLKSRLQTHIAKMKNRCYTKWKLVNAQSAQQIVERIYLGFDKFFKKENKRPPTYKKWQKYRSITFKQSGYALHGNILSINSIKLKLKFHLSRPIDGKIQTVSVKKDSSGDWWVLFVIKKEINLKNQKPKTGLSAGLDFGLRNFLTSSDGSVIHFPCFYTDALKLIRKQTKLLHRKQKSSKGYEKEKHKLSLLYRRIRNLRSDFQWKIAHKIISKYDIICIESLNLKGMIKIWGRKVNDLSFFNFTQILSTLCIKYNKTLIKINRWTPTTSTCFTCGYKAENMSLKTRTWICPNCKTIHDRDVNAAKNILRVGMSTLRGGTVRPQIIGVF